MKNLIKILIISVFCSACGGQDFDVHIDPEFEFYFNSFEEDFGFYPDINIAFEDGLPWARCKSDGINGLPTIFVNEKSYLPQYAGYDKEFFKSIIYHEIGHCIYDLKHDDTKLEDDFFPASIMTSKASAYQLVHIQDNWDYYKIEFEGKIND